MVIGLTGGTGTGKSLISEFFAQNGFEVIDYDKVTREVYAPGSECLEEITKAFGKDILNADGTLNRRMLGSIVFSDSEKLALLNKTVYKYILASTDEKINNSKDKKLLLDAPTLFDAGLEEKCDYVVGVIADKDLRLKRIMARDGIDSVHAQNRINSQKSDEFFRENCDFIIENNADKNNVCTCVNNILKSIKD